jgi:hypothetical protein
MGTNADMLAIVRQLPIPVPWDRQLFIENMARQRGRPIRLVPTDMSLIDAPCGVWFACDNLDIIFHEAGTSDYHIDQIVCHEIGHMVLEHDRGARSNDMARYSQLRPDLLPDLKSGVGVVRAILGRSDYSGPQERDAEMFASLLMFAAAEAEERESMLRNAFFRR